MKKSSFLLLTLLLSTVLIAQDAMPKNANTVIISGEFSRADKFNSIIDILLENGIGILESSKETGAITTAPKAFKHGTYSLTILVKDNKVTIRGQSTWDIIDPGSAAPIEYGGQKGSAKRNAWDTFQKITDQIPGTKEYIIKG